MLDANDARFDFLHSMERFEQEWVGKDFPCPNCGGDLYGVFDPDGIPLFGRCVTLPRCFDCGARIYPDGYSLPAQETLLEFLMRVGARGVFRVNDQS